MADELISYNEKCNIDLVIGNDYYDDVMKTEKIKIDSGLYLVNSQVGWVFSGRVMKKNCDDEVMMLMQEDASNDVNQFWSLETVGLKDVTMEKENLDGENVFEKSLMKVQNRYQVSWPWKVSKRVTQQLQIM